MPMRNFICFFFTLLERKIFFPFLHIFKTFLGVHLLPFLKDPLIKIFFHHKFFLVMPLYDQKILIDITPIG